jgi:hypothetical protein
MTTIDASGPPRAPLAPALMIPVGTVLLALAVLSGTAVAPAAAILVVVSGLAVGYRLATRWESLVGLTILVVLFIPIKRYKLPGSLPFDLEPYRIVLALVLALWLGALLADGVTRLRRTPLDAPLGLLALAVVTSIAVNPAGITNFNIVRSFVGDNFFVTALTISPESLRRPDLSTDVLKQLVFLGSFFLAFYLIVSVVRTPAQIDSVLKTLVVGASVVAVFALYERRTHYNVFDHLGSLVPVLRFQGNDTNLRSGGVRVLASAQHPIALAAMFVMLVPVALYLVHRTRQRRWWIAVAVVAMGSLATISRTAVVMAIAAAVVFAILRPAVVRAAIPFALPFLVAVHFVTPGAIGGLRASFFPSQGIVEDQTEYGGRISSKRLGPQFDIIRNQPLLGQGFGTRITAGENRNARILDDQWLGTAVETGLIGAGAWVWIFVRFVRRAGRAAREDDGPRGWLLSALAASVAAFAVGMLTFDAFSFIQVTVVMYILLALGCSTLLSSERWVDTRPALRQAGPRGLPSVGADA